MTGTVIFLCLAHDFKLYSALLRFAPFLMSVATAVDAVTL